MTAHEAKRLDSTIRTLPGGEKFAYIKINDTFNVFYSIDDQRNDIVKAMLQDGISMEDFGTKRHTLRYRKSLDSFISKVEELRASCRLRRHNWRDRKSTRLNSSHWE